jgi:hypothetical protein
LTIVSGVSICQGEQSSVQEGCRGEGVQREETA